MPHRRKSLKRTRRHRGGFYGFDGKVTPGSPAWTSGTEVPVKGGKKSRRKSRKTRKTKRRGGGVPVFPSFRGEGTAGMADFTGASTKA
jgi:hypothetical protein